jgi:hypothetical protein
MLVDSLAINNQLPLVAARQVEIAHQASRRSCSSRSRGSYTRGYSSLRSRASYSRGSFHRASDIAPPCGGAAVALSMKTPWQ